jgi:CTP:molybdopterin cytidylyltransferase MocA
LSLSKAIVILAAGLGRRFGGNRHKGLVPLILGEGSLRRLLRQLLLLAPDTKIVVVVGHQASEVAAAARRLSTTITCIGDARLASGSLLSTLVAGLDSLASDHQAQGAWVLFADTLYSPRALARLLDSGADRLLVASQPASAGGVGDRIGLRMDPTRQRLIALGPDEPILHGVMAPAVYWPRTFWSSVAEAAARGCGLQWQLLGEQLPQSPVGVLPLFPNHTRDIDTPDDLGAARRSLVDPLAVAFFRRTISKEERNLGEPDRLVDAGFLKVCESPARAASEGLALDWLRAARVGGVPTVRCIQGRSLLIEPLRGIRLYDLLRLLRVLEGQSPERAAQARSASLVLLRRSLEQLLRLQRALLAWPAAAQSPPYPLASHLAGLLSIVVRLLGLPPLLPAECRELRELRRCWEATDALIPFRDATTKNILVAIPELAPGPESKPDDRLVQLLAWLDRGDIDTVPLIDIDFTSVVHRTAPEDDLFSLLAHAGSLPVSERLLPQLVPGVSAWPDAVAALVGWIDPGIRRNRERAARALLVRYLRFGGRKLLYRMINPAAYAVRFRYDDPAFYFEQLPVALLRLDPGFGTSFPLLTDRLLQVRRAVALLPSWCASEASHNLYRAELGLSIAYWQESPLELPPLACAGPLDRG